MKVEFDISDDKIRSFTASAKTRLQEQAEKYTNEIIAEAEKVEELFHEKGASTEITDNAIIQAVRRHRTVRRQRIGVIIFRIIAELLLFVAGLLFMPEKFITPEGTFNVLYFALFALIALGAVTTTIVTYFVGGE